VEGKEKIRGSRRSAGREGLTFALKLSIYDLIMSSNNRRSLSGVLFPKSTQAILNALFTQAQRALHLRGLEQFSGQSSGTLQRVLDRMTAAGLVLREPKGRQVFYRANPLSPIFHELRALALKTGGLVEPLALALDPIRARIRVAFIHGSIARGSDRADSDVDVMIIGDVRLQEIVTAISGLQETLGRAINPITYTEAAYQTKLREGSHFLNSLRTEPKIFLIGDEHELDKLG
jgi:predicted nucleotidyltransferase